MTEKKRPAAKAAPKTKAPEPFITGTWEGHPNYQCSRCAFKTLDREEAVQHVIDRHAIKEAS